MDSSFHIFDPVTEKALLPNSFFVHGTSYAPDDTERSVEWPGSADVATKTSDIFRTATVV